MHTTVLMLSKKERNFSHVQAARLMVSYSFTAISIKIHICGLSHYLTYAEALSSLRDKHSVMYVCMTEEQIGCIVQDNSVIFFPISPQKLAFWVLITVIQLRKVHISRRFFFLQIYFVVMSTHYIYFGKEM